MENSSIDVNFTSESVTMTSNLNDTVGSQPPLEDQNTGFAMLEKVVAIVVPVFFSIVCLIGFFGNNLVILVVTFNKQMRNTTNLLILNLGKDDCGIFCPKLQTHDLIQTVQTSDLFFWCCCYFGLN